MKKIVLVIILLVFCLGLSASSQQALKDFVHLELLEDEIDLDVYTNEEGVNYIILRTSDEYGFKEMVFFLKPDEAIELSEGLLAAVEYKKEADEKD